MPLDMVRHKNEGSTHPILTIDHFCRLLPSLPEAIICDDTPGQRIIMANTAAEKLFGYCENGLIDQEIKVLYHNPIAPTFQAETHLNGNSEQVDGLAESIMRRKDGTIFPAEITSTPLKAEGVKGSFTLKLIRDISERKALEAHLRKIGETFKTIADFTYDWECLLQTDGNFQYVSPSCKRITGYTAEEFINRPKLFHDIIHPDDQSIWECHYHESRTGITCLREIHFRIIRADGEIRWIEHACQPVFNNETEIQGFRSSNRDITKRKTYEQDLTRALAEIEKYKEKLEAESQYLEQEISTIRNHDNIIGSSSALQQTLFTVKQVSRSNVTVLLLGETGTGKELFARAIHNYSPRKKRPMIKINCAAIPHELIENELFGHEKGSFTGADTRHVGRFGLADNGTIFLDEIGEMPPHLQAKLLRVLQEGEFHMVGSSKTTKVDVRVIAASNRDLERDVRDGLFRKDLWYRLNVYPITVPPLRDRIEDIPELVLHFTTFFCRKEGKTPITSFPSETIRQLKNYSWPGNVRELRNVIERAVLNSRGPYLTLADELQPPPWAAAGNLPTLAELERDYIIKVLEKTNWKTSGKNSAADILGMKRSTLRARMDKYNIRKP